ncbi:MAG: DNA internalization-related competence protein ComEC/Rec2 [bacterium]
MPGSIIPLTLGLALGIWAGAESHLEAAPAFGLSLFFLALGIGLAAAGRRDPAFSRILILVLLTAGTFFGGIFLRLEAEKKTLRDELAPWKEKEVCLEGVLTQDMRKLGRGKAFLLRVEGVQGAECLQKLSGLILVRLYPEETDFSNKAPVALSSLIFGARISARGILSEPSRATNPGESDYRLSLRRQGINSILTIKSTEDLLILGPGGGNPLWAFSYAVKRKLYEIIRKALPEPDASLLIGILLGEPSALEEELLSAFRGTGTLHLLAASGLNVGIVILFCLGLFHLMGISRRWACFWALPLILFYTLLAGASSSIVRAAIMGAMACLAVFFERENDLPATTFLAAFLMLIMKPFWLFDIGFQLSFLSVFSILWLTPALNRYFSALPPWLSMPLAVSLACQIGLWPLLAFYFNQFSLIAPLANLLVVPAASILLPMGLIQAVLGAVFLPLSYPVAGLNWLLMQYLEKTVRFLDRLPGAGFSLPTPPFWATLLFFGLLAALILMEQSRLPVSREAAVLIGLCLLAAILWWQALKAPPPMEVTFLDVGEGESTCIRMPSGETILIDGGPASRWLDRGEKTVLPFLRRRGVRLIESLIITHPHQDHLGGIPAILEKIPAGRIFSNGEDSSLPAFRAVQSLAEREKIPWQTLRSGQNIALADGASLLILNPSELLPPEDREEINDNSLAFIFKWRTIKILFAGDIGRQVEKKILASGMPLECDLLKVAHQGSSGSSGSEFLRKARPRYCVISAGRKNRFNHPSPKTLERLKEAGAFILRTDRDGAVTLTSDGKKIRIATMLP